MSLGICCAKSSFNKDVNLHVSHELDDKGDWAGPGLPVIILSCGSPRVQASLRPKSEPSWQPGGPSLQKSSLMAWCPRGGSGDSHRQPIAWLEYEMCK